jgi:hypothetical protein
VRRPPIPIKPSYKSSNFSMAISVKPNIIAHLYQPPLTPARFGIPKARELRFVAGHAAIYDWELGMSAAIKITCTDHTSEAPGTLAANSRDAAQSRRLLAIAQVLDGVSRLDAARLRGMDRQTLRDWVLRYN